jgi:CrcB protein
VETWLKVFVLSIGGSFGVNSRYWLGVWMNRWTSPQFPWATAVINVSGSFAIGFLTVVLTGWLPHPNIRLLLITGFLGGYTTFSTFEHDALTLWERGERTLMVANLLGSVVIGLGAVWLGAALARTVVEPGVVQVMDLVGQGETAVAGHSIRVGTDEDKPQNAPADFPEAPNVARISESGNSDDDPS